ncbi:tetratricopeptide repeat protein [Photobacterium japonica]
MQQQARFSSDMQQVKLALVLGELHRRFGHDNEAVHSFSLAANLVNDPSADPDLRVGARQSVAYHCHDMERYQQALGLNLAAKGTSR